jgi:hypothetical protein
MLALFSVKGQIAKGPFLDLAVFSDEFDLFAAIVLVGLYVKPPKIT